MRLAPTHRYTSEPFEIPYRGGRYCGDKGDVQGWLTWFFGGYELKELALIDDVLQRLDAPVVLDVGGNIGGHALSFARLAKEVHIFEPFEPLARRIAQQISANGYRHLHLHQVGLSDRQCTMPYFLDTSSRNQGTGSFVPGHNQSGIAAELDLVRGDDWLKNRIDRVDFIKIDIEGFEALALRGLAETLSRDRPYIVMEVTASSHREFAEQGGYREVIPFPCSFLRIANPRYYLGVLQFVEYQLLPLQEIRPESVSYNVLVVPDGREELASLLPRYRES